MQKPDYKNWVPKSMVIGLGGATAASASLFVLFGASDRILKGRARQVAAATFGAATPVLLFYTAWMGALHRTFDYKGKRKLAKTIIEGTADFVHIPDGGTGLDVGCGSGALTIACAKRNPGAQMLGCDIWSGAYKAVFTKKRCEENAVAEGVSNVRFTEGNAVQLPFPDESFDAVTSNYVRARYGDMDAFVQKLKAEGYEDLRLIDTTDGRFMGRREAMLLGLVGSTLLVGRK